MLKEWKIENLLLVIEKCMNSEDRIYIVAGNYEEAENFAKQNGIKKHQLFYVSNSDQLRGIRNQRILFCGRWKTRMDLSRIDAICTMQDLYMDYPEEIEREKWLMESTPNESGIFNLMEGNAVSTALDSYQSMEYLQAELICCLCKKPVERVSFEENYETGGWMFTIYCHGRANREIFEQKQILNSGGNPTELLRMFLRNYRPFEEDAARLNVNKDVEKDKYLSQLKGLKAVARNNSDMMDALAFSFKSSNKAGKTLKKVMNKMKIKEVKKQRSIDL